MWFSITIFVKAFDSHVVLGLFLEFIVVRDAWCDALVQSWPLRFLVSNQLATPEPQPGSGIKQGDALSPMIFLSTALTISPVKQVRLTV